MLIREDMIRKIKQSFQWDVIVIGGGATGLWCALDASSRGYKTLLIEKEDFASKTSSKSTKLFHGGLRYLKQGHISLVREALIERDLLAKNAPHLVSSRPFLIPYYRFWEKIYYSIGMQVYDFFTGNSVFQNHKTLSTSSCLKRCPTLNPNGLKGGCLYFDGQFDDTRFAIELAKTIDEHGGTVLNYCTCHTLIKQSGKLTGIGIIDQLTDEFIEVQGKVIINATGTYVDEIRKLDTMTVQPMITYSQGSHIVLDSSFLPSETAIIVPKTKDNRVIFIIPWLNKVLIGTTDIKIAPTLSKDPIPTQSEIQFLLDEAGNYLQKKPKLKDIRSIFSGVRPLIASSKAQKTSKLSRSHKILISNSGLVTIAGGKWTTSRKIAEDTINKAITVGHLEPILCKTKSVIIHKTLRDPKQKPLHSDFPYTEEDIKRAVTEELAITLIDVLARRTRALFLDVDKSLELAPKVVQIMAKYLEKDQNWVAIELNQYRKYAISYQIFSPDEQKAANSS